MKFLMLFLAFATIATSPLFAGDEKNIVPAVLKSATVYRNAAELSHTAKATLIQGNNELVIDDLSNNIDINSIQIHCGGAVTVMSIEFSKEYLKPEIRSPFEKKMDDSLFVLNKEIEKSEVLIKADNELIDLLRANKEIRGTQTGLSVAELIKMMDYYKQKSLELQNELSNYKEKQNKWNAEAEKLRNALAEEQRKNTKTSGKLILQLLSAMAGTCDFTISYITPTAYWNPAYDIKADKISEPLQLFYKAKLVQYSGIDWKGVQLTLSTSVPNQSGNAPVLRTWFLQYINPVAQMDKFLMQNSISSINPISLGKEKPGNLKDMVVTGYAVKGKAESTADNDDPLYIVNGKQMSAAEFGKIDQRAIKNIHALEDQKEIAAFGSRGANGVVIVELKDELDDYVTVLENQMNVSFNIDIPYDVPCNGKEQQVVLKQYAVPVFCKYYAVPKLDHDSYLLAEVSAWEKLNLLPGEANIIFENTYIGKTYIDPNSTLDTLNLTLGKDKRVVVKREKVTDYSSVKFLGSNKKQVFVYDITVKNNKKEKIQMMLKDQYPVSSNKEIEAELLETSGATLNAQTGVLTWKVELAPGESKVFR
ncbi:MAG TPA: DUF4139 domain-containing protein, partial [Puia sp.]|nr:DUF4139 domain-containing protein [Puia sp.]